MTASLMWLAFKNKEKKVFGIFSDKSMLRSSHRNMIAASDAMRKIPWASFCIDVYHVLV